MEDESTSLADPVARPLCVGVDDAQPGFDDVRGGGGVRAVIRREHDTDLIDRIANSPHVRPFICYHDGPIDWWPAIRGCCVLSNGEDAIGIFEQTAERYWQVHTLFDRTCRGRKALETAREMLAYMIPKYADAVWGATPMNNPAARWFNRQLGAEVAGHDTYEVEGPVEIFVLREVK